MIFFKQQPFFLIFQEQTETDWNGWEIGDTTDPGSMMDSFQTQEDASSVVSGEGGKSDTMYDSSNVEV